MLHRVELLIIVFIFSFLGKIQASDSFIILASTTSTDNSGLYNYLLPKFTSISGIEVRVVAVGTGRALALARNGDADVLLVHHKQSELEFVEQGYGVERFDVMYNDFILVGPASDPAGVKRAASVKQALENIYTSQHRFISRGDDSGTHKKELELWALANINPISFSGDWYQEVGRGMGSTLNIASATDAYTLTDRSTWIAFNNKQACILLYENGPLLHNQYTLILVDPYTHPHTKKEEGQTFIDWMLSPAGQAHIAVFRVDGQQLFFPNALN